MTEPPKKKRKLPPLDASFSAPPRRTDSPDLHQGRTRTAPHVQGQWATHIYLELEPSPAFRKRLLSAVDLARSSAPRDSTIHSLLDPPSLPSSRSSTPTLDTDAASTSEEALHLSLSRPLMLQTNQRGELRAGVARVAKEVAGFSAQYATFAVLENDEKTRRFLGIEVGPGYDQLRALLTKLDAVLADLRLPTYYAEPRFHTSLAWSSTTSTSATSSTAPCASPSAREEAAPPPLPFSNPTLEALEAKHGKALRAEEFWAGEVCVKIGKDVARFALSGRAS
ncbi:hypothetical protein JCM10207_000114 [Rhodosporidiobolus poonsookiae]